MVDTASKITQPPAGENRRRRALWWAVTAANLAAILYFGLNPKEGRFANSAAWIDGSHGLRFQKYAIAYSAPVLPNSPSPGVSLETAIKPLPAGQEGFALIIVLHDGDDGTQLLLGQWRNWLVFMNGDDYAHKRRRKRLAANIGNSVGKTIWVTVISGKESSHLFIDGKLIDSRSDTVFTIPSGKTGTRLVVGNSVYGKHSWNGDIEAISIYRQALSAQEVVRHYKKWHTERLLSAKPSPSAMYAFSEGRGELAKDSIGDADLKLPLKMPVLKKHFLSVPELTVDGNTGMLQDLLLNLLGFIPFGFALYKSIPLRGSNGSLRMAIAIVTFGFLVSLMIEITQAWMPARSSSLTDLVLNTAGTLVGAVAGIVVVRRERSRHE